MNQTQTKLQEGIAYFEQIRQMMPDDRATLEFLCIAYEQTGEQEKYLSVLSTLAQVLVRERDFASAQKLLEDLSRNDAPEARAAELKIRAMLVPAMGMAALKKIDPNAPIAVAPRTESRSDVVGAELKLIDWCENAKVVDHDLAEKVREHLLALAAVSDELLVSALTVLGNENPAAAESAAAALADETKTPPVALEMFDQVQTLVGELPERLVKIRGVVPFGKIADEMLVALANPMDADLRRQVAAELGCPCHFFLVSPLSLGIVLGRLFPDKRK